MYCMFLSTSEGNYNEEDTRKKEATAKFPHSQHFNDDNDEKKKSESYEAGIYRVLVNHLEFSRTNLEETKGPLHVFGTISDLNF